MTCNSLVALETGNYLVISFAEIMESFFIITLVCYFLSLGSSAIRDFLSTFTLIIYFSPPSSP